MLIGSNLEDHSYILVDKGCELPRLAGLGGVDNCELPRPAFYLVLWCFIEGSGLKH